MTNILKCGTCNKVLRPEDEGKTWNYFLKNFPPECYNCVGKELYKIEHSIKRVRINDNEF